MLVAHTSASRSRTRVAAGVAVISLALFGVACGDDSTLPAAAPPSTSTAASTSTETTATTTTPPSSAPEAAGTTEPTAPSTEPATSAEPPTTGPIGADFYQTRIDENLGGQFQTQVTNHSDDPFTVTGVRLRSPGFEQLEFEEKSTAFTAGQTTDLTTRYGRAVCDADLESSAAELRVERPNGGADVVEVPFDSLHVLEKVHRRECDAKAFAEAVDMHLGEMQVTEHDGKLVMSTALVLERRAADDDIVVDDTRGSVLITPILTSATGRELAAGAQRVEIPYEFEARSCMPHLLADVKKPFDFTVYVTIGAGEQQAVALVTTQSEKDQLWDYVLDYCDSQ